MVEEAIGDIVDADPYITEATVSAIGDATKKNKGPPDDVIKKCNLAIKHILGVRADAHNSGQTQLDADIHDSWVQASGDPETEVPAWLRAGTPMGIEVDAKNVGVFPQVRESCPEALRRPLELFNEHFANYISLEDSPHGEAVLQELVDGGFVKKVRSLRQAKRELGGHTPVTSKLAWFTTEKGRCP